MIDTVDEIVGAIVGATTCPRIGIVVAQTMPRQGILEVYPQVPASLSGPRDVTKANKHDLSHQVFCR
jgi:hypothetical protein